MRVSLLNVLIELEKQIKSSKNLVTKIKNLGLPRIQVEIIVELAFLRAFMAWESFLEESFIRYLVGGKLYSGHSPRRFVNPPNLGRATKIILGEGKEYIGWNSASSVIARSEIYFEAGEPYKNALIGAVRDIDNMNTIRNRIAHKSTSSRSKFNDFIRREFGYGVSGMTPGRFLLRNTISNPQINYFGYYLVIIDTAAREILFKV